MIKPLSPRRRNTVVFAAFGTLLATFPLLVLLPLRQAHRMGDAPYFMASGF